MLQTIAVLFLFTTPIHVICTGVSPSTASTPTPAAVSIPSLERNILKDMSWGLKSALLKGLLQNSPQKTNIGSPVRNSMVVDSEKSRPVGVMALQMPGRRENEDLDSDDSSMKMKLFRLMYETVRDSDLKVKRAELIKKSYVNSSSFEVGYLLGDITDKYNIMTDIGLTLKRLYGEWKPIEHINAYEQIANLAIEITHIVDLIRSLEKNLNEETTTRTRPTTTTTTTPSTTIFEEPIFENGTTPAPARHMF